jgi:hypothetical protein
MTFAAEKTFTVEGIRIPDTRLAREITQFVRDTESALLFHHSSRVYYWGALAGKHRGLKFDRELLYAGAMFHDMGLTPAHSSAHERFEVDGANAARDFLRGHGIGQDDIDTVWTAIALHTTPSIPQHMHPIVALVTAGVEMDVLGLTYAEYSDAAREAVVHAHPRTEQFKEDIIQAFYDGIKHKPDTTFGNVKADVLADKDPAFRRGNFCSVIRGSAWRADGPRAFSAAWDADGTKKRLACTRASYAKFARNTEGSHAPRPPSGCWPARPSKAVMQPFGH